MLLGRMYMKINLIFFLVVLFFFFLYGLINFDFLLIFVIGFLVGILFLILDLDMYSNVYNKWGFLCIFWYFYKKVMLY